MFSLSAVQMLPGHVNVQSLSSVNVTRPCKCSVPQQCKCYQAVHTHTKDVPRAESRRQRRKVLAAGQSTMKVSAYRKQPVFLIPTCLLTESTHRHQSCTPHTQRHVHIDRTNCTDIHTHTCAHTHTHTCMHAHTCTYTHTLTCMHACTHTRTCTCTLTCRHAHAHTHTYTHTHACTHAHTHIHTHTHTH